MYNWIIIYLLNLTRGFHFQLTQLPHSFTYARLLQAVYLPIGPLPEVNFILQVVYSILATMYCRGGGVDIHPQHLYLPVFVIRHKVYFYCSPKRQKLKDLKMELEFSPFIYHSNIQMNHHINHALWQIICHTAIFVSYIII